jgi:ATP-dependent Clp endopeptidase proteolytic subunit ClpP
MGKLIDFKSHKSFDIQNKGETTFEIFLYGSIGDSPWDDTYISEKVILAELQKIPKTAKNIHLRVNSSGGSVFTGVTIYELLKNHPAKVTAYVEGLAASIASVIIMAADEVVMGEGAMLMLHKPLVGIYGNAHEMEKMIDILDKIESQMVGIYARKTKKSAVELHKILSEDTWYTTEQAIEAGLADRTFESSDESRYLAACLIDKSPFRNKPNMKTHDAMVREKVKDFKNNVKNFLARK